jgi:GNAT superfamily N-acetyltransferase
MNVVPAVPGDANGFLALAAEVENWFGPMLNNPQFHAVIDKKIQRGTAYVVHTEDGGGLLGGLLLGGSWPTYHINWLVVTANARGQGVGRALINHATGCFQRPCRVDVITFGPDHPGAVVSGARRFYAQLGFQEGDAAPRGPEGGSRQCYHLTIAE